MKVRIVFIIAFVLWSTGYAAPPEPVHPTIPEYAKTLIVPEFLFHWTSPGSLRKMAEKAVSDQLLPLKVIAGSSLQGAYNSARGPGLFAWSNPITGMGLPSEIFNADEYAKPDSETGEPARLLVMKLRHSSSIRVVTTGSYFDSIDFSDDLRSHDLIFHLHFDYSGRNLLWQEWIIVNSKAIESFTADPNIGAKFVRQELDRLNKPTRSFTQSEIHQFLGGPIPKVMAERLRQYLENIGSASNVGIPKMFLKPFKDKAGISSCHGFFSY